MGEIVGDNRLSFTKMWKITSPCMGAAFNLGIALNSFCGSKSAYLKLKLTHAFEHLWSGSCHEILCRLFNLGLMVATAFMPDFYDKKRS